jgi:predicted Zn-dependent protease
MPDLLPQSEFRRLSQTAFESAGADDVRVNLSDRVGGTTRFANNQITQNVRTHRAELTVGVAFGKRAGAASTTNLTDEAIRATVKRAEQIAQVTPEDPEYLPPVEQQLLPVLPTRRADTAAAGPQRRFDAAKIACDLCAAAGMQAAGIAATYTDAVGLAANNGLFAYEQRSRADFSLTATATDSSGWSKNAVRSLDDLDVEAMTRRAIDKARNSADPREIPAGRMTVILEPPAVQGLIGPLIGNLGARRYHRGTSALAGKHRQRIIDSRLTLRNRPEHPSLLGSGFNSMGMANNYFAWIENGVLKHLDYDRFTATQHAEQPTTGVDAAELSGPRADAQSLDDLIAGTAHGVLVTHFWYIRYVNRTDLTLTGMTRDGTFLIKDGRIAGGVHNFRFQESPLVALNQVEAFTEPDDAIATEGDKMMLPALRIRDFNFASVTRF